MSTKRLIEVADTFRSVDSSDSDGCYQRLGTSQVYFITKRVKNIVQDYGMLIKNWLDVKKELPMIEGIGIDLVEMKRIEKVIARQNRFSEKILTQNERNTFQNLQGARRVEFLAGRFAAKEAYVKACGCGIGKVLSWKDIEVVSDESGKPKMVVNGNKSTRIHLSITHTKEYAAAQVVIES